MTKSELAKGVALRLITAVVFGVIGYFAIYYALQMVAIFGEGMGVDARSKEIYASSHMVVHLFGAACALAIGVFHQSESARLRNIAVWAILLCGAYGVVNMIGFTSTNRVAVAAVKDAKKDAAERDYQQARQDLQNQIAWLGKQTVFAENTREKARMEKEVDAKRKELSAIKAPVPTADTVLSDPQATTFEKLSRGYISADTWKYAIPVPLAFLMFFAEAFSLSVVGFMVAGAIALIVTYKTAARTSEPSKTQAGSGGSGSGEPTKIRQVHPEPAKASGLRTMEAASFEPPKVSSAGMRFLPGLPTAKLSAFDKAYAAAIANPHLSTRELTKIAGTSQTTNARVKKRLRGKADQIVRRYGNGGVHIPAYN